MATDEALQQLEAELRAFGRSCRQGGMSASELSEICRPLTSVAPRGRLGAVLALLTLATLYGLYVLCAPPADPLHWHASAVARILFIKILPFWNWTPLFYRQCLINKSAILKETQNALTASDCAVCEAIVSVQHISRTNYDSVLNNHLIRGAPVIVSDANTDWALSKQPDINLTRVLSEDERLRDSVPCILQTNLRAGRQPADLNNLLTKITQLQIPNWFVHFQNCDLRAVKSLRVLAPRPYFLSPHVPPAHFNWLLMSDKYSSPRFKSLELDPGLIILSQLKGGTVVRLNPRNPCEDSCPSLTFDILQGETLALANSMWNFEYIPDENSENIAILTETAWNEA